MGVNTAKSSVTALFGKLEFDYFSLFLYALYPAKQAKAITIGMTAYPALAVPLDVRTKIAPTNVSTVKTIDNTNNNFFIQSHSLPNSSF